MLIQVFKKRAITIFFRAHYFTEFVRANKRHEPRKFHIMWDRRS